MRKWTKALAIALLLIIGSGFAFRPVEATRPLHLLILHSAESDSYLDAYQHFAQTRYVGIEVTAEPLSPSGKPNLKQATAVYLDGSLAGDPALTRYTNELRQFVEQGGMLFVENDLHASLPLDLIGGTAFRPLGPLPKGLSFPEVKPNAAGVQKIVRQFHHDAMKLYDLERLSQLPLGQGVVPSTAWPLVQLEDGTALYTLNQVGKGFVLFASKLLPNDRFVTGFDLLPKQDGQPYLNFTLSAGSYMIREAFLEFVLKERDGVAVSKVLGTNGRPAMAWQNHFEVLSAIREGSMQKWIDFLKGYDQIPSFSLVREAYDWGVWREGVTVHANKGSNREPAFAGELEGSQYSSGSIARSGDDWLHLAEYPEPKSLAGTIEQPFRAYVDTLDENGDGVADLIAGSHDGRIYRFRGQISAGEWRLGSAEPLRLASGAVLDVGEGAAPVLYDIDGDGRLDLVVGTADGDVLLFLSVDGQTYRPGQRLVHVAAGGGYAGPTIGDVDGDGIPDLIVGTAAGHLYLYRGLAGGGASRQPLAFATEAKRMVDQAGPIQVDRFAAPRFVSSGTEGRPNLLVGEGEGFIRRYVMEGPGQWRFQGFLEGETTNQFGDRRLWGGRNAVPALADLTGDGIGDLLVGQLIFGFAIPIDSPAFPYKEELQRALAYAREHFIEIQPHVLVHNFKSPAQEERELALHREAFTYYGLPWNTGVNQHTWRTNDPNPRQTLESEARAGLWWNSGFRPGRNPLEPTYSGEYMWAVPFRLAKGQQIDDFIVFNPAPFIPTFEPIYPTFAALDMPISYFYHMEYPILDDAARAEYTHKAEFLDRFRTENDYNFMTEGQMFKSFMAAFKTKTRLEATPITRGLHALQNRLRTKQQYAFRILSLPDPAAADRVGPYQEAVGYKVELGERYDGYVPVADAEIYMYRGATLYVGGKRSISVRIEPALPDAPHLVRANLPVTISRKGSDLEIDLRGEGLQQLKFYAPDGLTVLSEGWEVDSDGPHHLLTRYGGAGRLQVRYGK